MPTSISESLAKELQLHANDAYNEGISEGLVVAEEILSWWANNHKNTAPFSFETLNKWSKDRIKVLRAMKRL